MSRDSDVAIVFGARNQVRQALRSQYGVRCAACRVREPRRDATILLPGQRCYCGYIDPRTKLTKAQKNALQRAQ